ncbi:MAG: acetate--CoA ligase family protein, partial [Candidatus Limnocylindrales bacterium]
PTMGYVGNPLDPWGAAEPATAYGAAFEAMAASGAYDVLAIVHDFPYRSLAAEVATANEVTQRLLSATRDRPEILPVYVSLTSGEPPPATKALLDADGHGAPLLRGALEAFSAIASLARWERRRARRGSAGPWRTTWPDLAASPIAYSQDAPLPARDAIDATASEVQPLSERESLDLLRAAGLAVTSAIAVPDADAAVEAARPLGGHAVALKVDAPGLVHKSDLGLVRLGLIGDDAVRAAADDLFATARRHGLDARGLLVEPMADAGLELIVGLRRDPSFGPVVLVGLGGLLAETIDDVAIRLAPIGRDEASAMLADLRGAALLDGVRGRPRADRAAVVDLIVGLARMAVDRPDIAEVDLNPVIASPDGALAVDALVVLREYRPGATDG